MLSQSLHTLIGATGLSVEKIHFLLACCLFNRSVVNCAITNLPHYKRSDKITSSDVLVIRASLCAQYVPGGINPAGCVAYVNAPAADLGKPHSWGGGCYFYGSGKECVPGGRTQGPIQKWLQHHAILIT